MNGIIGIINITIMNLFNKLLINVVGEVVKNILLK